MVREQGNATLLETEHVRVLVNQGFSGASLERRLKLLDLHPKDLTRFGDAPPWRPRWRCAHRATSLGLQVHANARTAEELSLLEDLWHPFVSSKPFNST